MNRFRLVPNYQSHRQILTSEFSILLFLYVQSIVIQLERTERDNMSKEEGENRIDSSIYFNRGVSVSTYRYVSVNMNVPISI